MGIKKDIKLVNDDYQWLGSMFYFGEHRPRVQPRPPYLKHYRLPCLGVSDYQTPATLAPGEVLLLLHHHVGISSLLLRGGEQLPGSCGCSFLPRGFRSCRDPGLCTVHLAGMTIPFPEIPSYSHFLQWYTKKEQGTRTGIWFSFNGFAQIFGGLVAYGIARGARLHGTSIAPWKIIFLVTGLLTAAIGCIFLFIMPDNQLNARWLSKTDRKLAIERVRVNQQGIGNKHFKAYQLKEALADPLTWAFAFYALTADVPNGGISNFFSQLIVSFGYTAEQSLLYGTPGGVVEIVALIVCGFLGDRYGNRILISCSGLVIAIIGMLLIVALPLSNNGGRLGGYYLTQASPTPFVALLSLISSNVAGYTKKTTVAALYLIAYCAGNIIGKCPAIRALPRCRTDFGPHRSADLPSQRYASVQASRDHHHLLLGRLLDRSCLHLVVLPKSE